MVVHERKARRVRGEPGAAPLDRLIARITRTRLDKRLADGADPSTSAALAARAAQLTEAGTRQRIAAGLERIALAPEALATTQTPAPRLRVMPSRRAVAANRHALLDLASMLRRGGPLYAQGLAMLELVLLDGAGPAYTDRHGEALTRELELAGLRLRDGGLPPASAAETANRERCER